MMGWIRGRVSKPLLLALAVVALSMGGLLAGYGPVGGDPDCLYQPIKSELARSLREGGLPFWSDRFGLGVPLVAESHAAAFYPPNWLLYRVMEVGPAYRLAMWLNYLALVVATYGYGRSLGLSPQGSALAGMTLALSGFQASHSAHEPFYHALPYLPLALMIAERYMADGKVARLALLALVLAAQLTLGHFQIQMWTAGLVVLTGIWRARSAKLPWRRAAGLAAAVAGAGAIAGVQLALTYDLTRAANFNRTYLHLSLYSFPPTHWGQLVLPRLFMGTQEGVKSPYWGTQLTTPDEACLYVGSIALIFASCGFVAGKDSRPLNLWRWAAPIGFVLATMPRWSPDGYWAILHFPGVGHFRAPGRYTLLTTLGLCLLAGRGFDRALTARRFWVGYGLAAAFGAAAIAWGVAWSGRADVRGIFGSVPRLRFILEGSACWIAGLAVVGLWRAGRLPWWVPFLAAACELAYLYHNGTTPNGRPVRLPDDSPTLRLVAALPDVGLVAGGLQNVPVRVGLTTAFPNMGIVAPPPNYLIEESTRPFGGAPAVNRLARFGVTHAIYEGTVPSPRRCKVLYLGPDPALDAIVPSKLDTQFPRLWRVEGYPDIAPEARCARKVRTVADWTVMYPEISKPADLDEVLYIAAEAPPEPPGPRARSARVARWDGRSGEVEHDGTCDLVFRRTYVPGWTARLDDGPEFPVVPADGGLQAIRIPGSGVTRVTVRYHPATLTRGLAVSLTALVLACLVIGFSAPVRSRPTDQKSIKGS
jgi:hypothetical protein